MKISPIVPLRERFPFLADRGLELALRLSIDDSVAVHYDAVESLILAATSR